MVVKFPSRIIVRFYFTLLSASAFGLSMTPECNDFGLKNVNNEDLKNVNNDDGKFWKFYRFEDPMECFHCFLCFLQTSKDDELPELVLPCLGPNLPSVKEQVQIWYRFRIGKSGNQMGNVSLDFSIDEDTDYTKCQNDMATGITDSGGEQRRISNFKNGTILMRDINSTISYHLEFKPDNLAKNSMVCLTNLELIGTETTVAVTTDMLPTTEKENPRNGFPIGAIFLIILIVILGICAIAGVLIRQRKLQENQQENHLNAGRDDSQSKQIKGNTGNDKDVISNATYDQEFVNDKGDEYHSYNEIDIKEPPPNSEMIYNSAYESSNSNAGRDDAQSKQIKGNTGNDKDVISNATYGQEFVNDKGDEYHSYHEIDIKKPPPNGEMIYNSAYESSNSN